MTLRALPQSVAKRLRCQENHSVKAPASMTREHGLRIKHYLKYASLIGYAYGCLGITTFLENAADVGELLDLIDSN